MPEASGAPEQVKRSTSSPGGNETVRANSRGARADGDLLVQPQVTQVQGGRLGPAQPRPDPSAARAGGGRLRW